MTIPSLRARHNTVDAISFEQLIMPGAKLVYENYIIKGGQVLAAGSVLGQITSGGKLQLTASAAGDGSQTPMAVLMEPLSTYDTDGTTPLDMSFQVLVAGKLNAQALVLGAGHTIASVKTALRDRGIFLTSQHYSG